MHFVWRVTMVLFLSGGLFAWGCGDDDDSATDSGPDMDTDTDTDADSDSDTDADTDTDTDPVCEPTEPPDEICDGIDNDCDGTTDNVPTLGDSCTGGLGECEATGVLVCNTISEELECDADEGTPVVEICDDLDNDCDGTTDNVDTLGDPCTVGVGECEATGTNICDTVGQAVICSATEGAASTEICDTLDNDCDGTTDNVLDLGNSCTVGDGECEATGQYICNFTTTLVECDAVAGTPDVEICDGLDNDCDGTSDNVAGLGAVCSEGVGECEATGQMICNTTLQDLECNAVAGTPTAESCDMLDNDCNGYADDDLFDDDDDGPIPAGAPSITLGTSTFTVTVGSGTIQDVDVHLDISHTWDEDLDVTLESPLGTIVELFSDVGSGGDDFTQTTLDDEATTDITAGSAPFTGSFVPENPLSAFDGEDAAGIWTLTITDDSSGDHGTLNDWALEVRSDSSPCWTNGVANDDGETYYRLTVEDQSVIMDLNVALEMTHPMLSDLTVYIISPEGTQVELFSGIGGTGADLTGTVLDDEGATDITAGTAPFTGSFIPENLLSAFDGEQLQGNWYLRVVDGVAGNEGEVLSWNIDIPCFGMGAGTTCAAIKAADTGATDGTYCLDPTSSEDWFEAHCDMTTDGGGWTMMMRLNSNDSATRWWGDSFWTTTTEIGDLDNEDDYLSFAYDLIDDWDEILVDYRYTTDQAKRMAAVFTGTNTGTFMSHTTMALSNTNPDWARSSVYDTGTDADAANWFGSNLKFQTIGNGTDNFRIWYNQVAVDACNQAGGIGCQGDGGGWYNELSFPSNAGACQENDYRGTIGSNGGGSLMGEALLAPTDAYDEGIMYVLVR